MDNKVGRERFLDGDERVFFFDQKDNSNLFLN